MPLLQKAYQSGGGQPYMGGMSNLDPEQLKQAEEMFKNMSLEQRQQMEEMVKNMGGSGGASATPSELD
jgi:hypothetical protein